VDSCAYTQPYAFGKVDHPVAEDSRFYELPVVQFEENHNARTFATLREHFRNLWETSDVDLFHMQAREEEHEKIVKKVFADRGDWIPYVLHAVGPKPNQRTFPRRQCQQDQLKLDARWEDPGNKSIQIRPVERIRDVSFGGLGISLEPGPMPPEGAILEIKGNLHEATGAVKFLVRHMRAADGVRFKVVHTLPGSHRLGLKSIDI
jgi:hypothetical protein